MVLWRAVEGQCYGGGAAIRTWLCNLNPAVVRAEILGGILGGDPALDAAAVRPDRVLAESDLLQSLALRDPDLSVYQIYTERITHECHMRVTTTFKRPRHAICRFWDKPPVASPAQKSGGV